MNHHNTLNQSATRTQLVAGLALALALTIASPARALIVENGDFETDPNPSGFQGTATGWTLSSNAGLFKPGSDRMSSQNGNNDTVTTYTVGGVGGSARQTLQGITLANNTRYTLTVDVGADSMMSAGHPQYPFPTTLGNGVSTGDVFARLLANSGASAMPGFLPGSSTVTAPTPGDFTPWTLVWQTGANETFAGTPLVVDLSVLNNSAYFDNVALTTEFIAPVPEPSTVLLLGLGGLVVWRKARRNTQR